MSGVNLADIARWDIFTRQYIDPKIYDWVACALRDLDAPGSCVAVSACNGAGKSSSIIANAVLCHLLQYPTGRVICTSAVERQLTHVIMGYLRSKIDLFPKGSEFNKQEIFVPKKDKEGRVIGQAEYLSFTTNDPGKAEGWHGSEENPLLLIIDEGKTVESDVYSAFDRCTAQRRLVVSSPPVEATGEFYEIFQGRGSWPWKLHKVNYWMCPHIEKQSPGKAEKMKEKYGEDSPIYRSMILGEFSQDSSLSVINSRYIDKAMYNPPEWNKDTKRRFAIDWSAGSDEQIGGKIEGNRVTLPIIANEHDTNKIVERMAAWLKKEGAVEGEVIADDGGLGRPMNYSLEKLLGFNVGRFNGGLPANQPIYYANRINEVWFTANDALRSGYIILPQDEKMRHQAISRRKEIGDLNESRLKMETKKQMKKRGEDSPDRFDVVAMLLDAARPILPPESLKEKPKQIETKDLVTRFLEESDWQSKKRLDFSEKSDISVKRQGLFPVCGSY